MNKNSLFESTGIKMKVIQEILQLAKTNSVKKVVLFGSRARGDYKERSDIDLAFQGGNSSRFILDVDEETSTLLEFDIIDLDKPVREELLDSIKREGILLYGNVELAGMVGLYEICFEQSWKAMKEILENSGYSEGATGSPRAILKTAYKAGMINDEEMWLDALISRNNVAHAYNKSIAMDIIHQTKDKYYDMFVRLQNTIDQHWI